MTEFEDKVCKVLGFILFLLIVTTWLQISGCSRPVRPHTGPEYIDDVKVENLV
jgi:hypothetical protein|tara:strand:+ start:420 stop:578 length:159 start_codon:yes stop_codon:yes gene_type:complete